MSNIDTVILITADSFRYDILERTVGGEVCCPFLDSIATKGTSFSSAYSTGNGTSAAFPGILASAYPFDHGYRGLVDEHVPIAEYLETNGVRTTGITSSSHACSLFNYDRGFNQYYENPAYRPEAVNRDSLSFSSSLKQSIFDTVREIPVAAEIGERTLNGWRSLRGGDEPSCPFERAEKVTDKSISFIKHELETHPDEQRFMWVHYMEPHGPYLPPESVLESVDTPSFSRSAIEDLWDRWFDNRPEVGTDGTSLFTAEERTALEQFYLLQARYLDTQLRRLHEFIDSTLGYEDTLLLFTSDHGEEFFEHGDLGHRPKLVEELIHVPLIAYSEADRQKGETDELVSHVDLGPTIAAALGIEPHDKWQGTVVAPIVSGATSSPRHHAFSELCHTEGYGGEVRLHEALHSVSTADWKYVRDVRTDTEQFYRRDGTTLTKIKASEAAADHLRRLVDDRRKSLSDQTVDSEELSDDIRDRLHQLGYVGE